jgi:hypothetical protein
MTDNRSSTLFLQQLSSETEVVENFSSASLRDKFPSENISRRIVQHKIEIALPKDEAYTSHRSLKMPEEETSSSESSTSSSFSNPNQESMHYILMQQGCGLKSISHVPPFTEEEQQIVDKYSCLRMESEDGYA